MLNILAGESLVMRPIQRHWIYGGRWLLILTLMSGALLSIADIIGLSRGIAWVADATTSCDICHAQLNVIATKVDTQELRLAVTLVILAAYGLGLALGYLGWSSNRIIVTDQRLLVERGVLFRRTTNIPLDRISDIVTSQNLLGEILNYGSVVVAFGFMRTNKLRWVSSPVMLRDQLFVLSELIRRG